jgi:hypothetical protein
MRRAIETLKTQGMLKAEHPMRNTHSFLAILSGGAEASPRLVAQAAKPALPAARRRGGKRFWWESREAVQHE